MKFSRMLAVLVPSIFLSVSISCTIRYYDTNKLINDYTTEGFLDRDHFQVIVKGTPDKESRGLVAQRDSAFKHAKDDMEKKAIESLVSYNLNYHINKLKIEDINDIRNLEDLKKSLTAKLDDFLKFGYLAFEYYNDDNSAVIVYRIFSDDLVEKIESIKPDIRLNDEKTDAKRSYIYRKRAASQGPDREIARIHEQP